MDKRDSKNRNKNIENKGSLPKEIASNIDDQKLEAASLIERIDSINSRRAFKKVSSRIDKKRIPINVFNQISRIAAILLIPALIVSIWYNSQNIETTEYVVNCPIGIKTQLALPDGSMVWLNSGTTIKYNLPFKNKSRHIELEGEAYLKIKKDPIPFIINSGEAMVKVYGTEFNVKAYASENQIEIALKEGSVGFSTSNGKHIKKLLPNDYLVYNKKNKSVEVTNKNLKKHIAWRNNQLIFDDTSLAEVATMLERWYGINVKIKEENLLKHKLTATFENESLLQVIDLLELSSPIKIKYISSKIDTNSKVTSKAKILIYNK